MGWATFLGNGGGITHRTSTQETHPTGASCPQTGARLPAHSALDWTAQGPAQLPSLSADARHSHQESAEENRAGRGEESQDRSLEARQRAGRKAEPGRPTSHPLKESGAPGGGAAAGLMCPQQREARRVGPGST